MISNKRRLVFFAEFLVFGFALALIEDIIAVLLATGESFSWEMLVIVSVVAIPFAIIGEFVLDRTKLIPRKLTEKNYLEVFTTFFLFGFVMGLAEDLLAVVFATGHSITPYIVGICALVAFPFALFGMLVVNRVRPSVRGK